MSEKLNHIKQLQFFKSLNFEQLNDLAKIANIIKEYEFNHYHE